MIGAPSRILVALTALALTVAVSSGCGGGDATGTTSAAEPSSTTEAGSESVSDRPLTADEAVDLARRINLRASDFPYFEEESEDDDDDPQEERQLEREFSQCMGGGIEFSDPLADLESETYGGSGGGAALTVSSAVEVVGSADLAEEHMALYARPRTLACFRRLYIPAFEEEGSAEADVGRVEIRHLPVPLPALEDGVGLRVSAKVTVTESESALTAYHPQSTPVAGGTLPVYVDVFVFAAGPAEVTLIATGVPSPVSKNLERNLLGLLHERATAQQP